MLLLLVDNMSQVQLLQVVTRSSRVLSPLDMIVSSMDMTVSTPIDKSYHTKKQSRPNLLKSKEYCATTRGPVHMGYYNDAVGE
jgi:hypothetical protein